MHTSFLTLPISLNHWLVPSSFPLWIFHLGTAWQVGVHQDDQYKTTFTTHWGLFEFQVLSRLIEFVLAGLIGSSCLILLCFHSDLKNTSIDYVVCSADSRMLNWRLNHPNVSSLRKKSPIWDTLSPVMELVLIQAIPQQSKHTQSLESSMSCMIQCFLPTLLRLPHHYTV